MNERFLSSVEYKCISQQNNEKQEIVINEKNENKLSPISLSILDSVLSHRVTLVFSQGPFNLSSLISCLFGFHKPSDILVGMPKTRFNERFEKNTDVFFSLIYKKLINSIPSSSFYFYHDVLWCKGHINEETNEMIDIEVLTRPKYGTRKYKNDSDFHINEKLTHGNLQKIPKIVSIPIDELAPASILGKKSIKFKNENYNLKNFDPKLIIYESINERKYSFENLLLLINKSEKLDVKIVLHFSWSYLKGLSSFLSKVKYIKDVNILHLGKRICIESKNTFKRPPDNVISLSLEGNLWDLYYPVNTSFDLRIILPALNAKYNFLSSEEIVYWDWALDYRVSDIRDRLKFDIGYNIEKSILEFPPVLDSFLSPSETKRRCVRNGTWMTLPINDAFTIKTSETSLATCVFNGLCSDLEKCKDIAYEMRGLFTTTAVSKKTLLQAYLIEKMSQLCFINSSKSSEEYSGFSIFIANLHPYLPTQSSFFESIRYLVESIKNLIKLYKHPRLIIQDNLVYMEIELSNGEKLKEIILKDGEIQDRNLKIIKRILSIHFKYVLLNVVKKDSVLEITFKVKEPIEYLEFSQQNNMAYKKCFDGLILYCAVIENYRLYKENRFSDISLEHDINNLSLLIEINQRTEKIQRINNYKIQLLYSDLSKMQALPKEFLQNSELLIPGPIPFHTISDQDILISHGYDALLLPFKKIIFFAYPGMNFKQLLRQVNLYKDLISEDQTNVSKRDLSFSINYTNKSRRFNLPSKPHLIEIQDDSSDGDTLVDTIIRQELLYDSHTYGYELEDIKTLRAIWDTIQKKKNVQSQPRFSVYESYKECMTFCVEYETGVIETVSFSIDTLMRKKDGNDYIILPVSELSVGDQIFYVQSDERESIENYLLRTVLSEDEMTLEKILEPLTALKNFYETLNSLDFEMDNYENQMKKIDWLSIIQKRDTFYLLRSLIDKKFTTSEVELQTLISNSIWNGANSEKMVEIFNKGSRKVTISKLFDLAVEFGLKSYKEASFKGLCSTAINEQTHYSFHNEKNLLSLGKLLGHQNIINNYQNINEKGSMIGKFLRQVGFSMQRIVNGTAEPFNDIDIALEQSIKKCKIVKTEKC